ncbi:hypothetical protein [Bosea sp. (in: a-proteobacteria)]|uniref:hypothetical protein n=1 Tax=Bosea sp. (in: a-proteobacteria) TaxID=1871050 RepID=UPI003F6EADB9
MKRIIAIALLFAAGAAADAAEGLPGVPRLQDYEKARKSLLAQGWRPITLPEADECQPGDRRCAGRPETFACVGFAGCIFTWRRGGTVIDVVTQGEGSTAVSGLRCRGGCQ